MPSWDENGKPVASSPKAWDENGNPIGQATEPAKTASSIIRPESNPTVAAQPQPQGMFGRAQQWLGDAAEDIRHGSANTVVGRTLGALGAKGTDTGNPHEVGEYMASAPLGILRAAQGATEIPQGKFAQGAKDIGGGALQDATMPMQMMAGPEAEAVAEGIHKAVPSAARAGAALGDIKKAAATVPVDVEAPGAVAMRMKELEQTGATMPKVARQYAERVTNPDKGPLLFPESRDFASNAGRLSVAERLRTQGEMGGQVKQLAKAISESNRNALPEELRPAYDSAMTEYRRAKQIKTAAGVAGAAAIGATKAGAVFELAKRALGAN